MIMCRILSKQQPLHQQPMPKALKNNTLNPSISETQVNIHHRSNKVPNNPQTTFSFKVKTNKLSKTWNATT